MRKYWLLSILLISSCGWVDQRFGRMEGGSTEAHFQFGNGGDFSAQALELYGNIAVYLVGVNGTPYSTNMTLGNKFDNASITLPNGSYRVYAIGWDGDNSGACTAPSPCSPGQGQVRCSSPNLPVLSLTGGTASVNLTMNTANCDFTIPTAYTPGMAAATDFKQMGVYLCGPSSTLPGSCNTPTTRDVSMELVVYQKQNGSFTVIESLTKKMGCIGGANNGGTGTAKNFPVGNPSANDRPFAVRFRLFASGSGCSGTVYQEFLFSEGLTSYAVAPGAANAYFDYVNGGWGSQSVLKLKAAL